MKERLVMTVNAACTLWAKHVQACADKRLTVDQVVEMYGQLPEDDLLRLLLAAETILVQLQMLQPILCDEADRRGVGLWVSEPENTPPEMEGG
jgi:hypothetical protein